MNIWVYWGKANLASHRSATNTVIIIMHFLHIFPYWIWSNLYSKMQYDVHIKSEKSKMFYFWSLSHLLFIQGSKTHKLQAWKEAALLSHLNPANWYQPAHSQN